MGWYLMIAPTADQVSGPSDPAEDLVANACAGQRRKKE
jgi:hypothetical protein